MSSAFLSKKAHLLILAILLHFCTRAIQLIFSGYYWVIRSVSSCTRVYLKVRLVQVLPSVSTYYLHNKLRSKGCLPTKTSVKYYESIFKVSFISTISKVFIKNFSQSMRNQNKYSCGKAQHEGEVNHQQFRFESPFSEMQFHWFQLNQF